MKINFEPKKGSEFLANVKQKTTVAIQKTAEMSKQVANNVVENVEKSAIELSEKSKQEGYDRRMKKYNPLFPEKYRSTEFNLPNMVVIVDDAVRRGIDVCEGAIGWLSNQNGMEVLHLYDEYIQQSGIQFVPAPICDAVYYVDRFDRNRFVQTECIFSKAHEERMAELKNIAYMLGAKGCSIEISESSLEIETSKSNLELKVGAKSMKTSSEESATHSSAYKGSVHRSGRIVAEFSGSRDVKRPDLKWFMHDETIKGLIDIRCSDPDAIKSEMLVLEGNASATMSQKTAYAIDNALSKIHIGVKSNMEGQAIKENRSKLIFNIEF